MSFELILHFALEKCVCSRARVCVRARVRVCARQYLNLCARKNLSFYGGKCFDMIPDTSKSFSSTSNLNQVKFHCNNLQILY
jgi:hypothetical protein